MVCINLAHDGYINGLNGDKAVMESWARGVEILITNRRYRQIGNPNYSYFNNFQDETIQANREYTAIVIDMIDNHNQRVVDINGNPRFDPNLPQDRVSGYTILQIEQGLRGSKSWHDWRSNMINRFNNPTQNRVVELFTNWH